MRATAIGLGCVLVLAAAGGGAWAAEEAQVPDLVTKPVAVAMKALQDVGLTAHVIEVAGPTPDVVDGQDPPAGTTVPKGSEVTLWVGTAVRIQTQVPEVTGRLLDDVARELESVYVFKVEFQPGPAEQAGKVVAQEPKAGATLPYRGVLHLTVVQGGSALGAPPGGVLVPGLIGQPEAAAVQALQALGLQGSVTKVKDPAMPQGVVVSQDPPSGAEMLPGGTVFLRVSGEGAAPAADGKVVVPLAVGLPMTEAEAAILGAGLIPRSSLRVAPEVPAWSCVGQNPPAGDRVPPGTVVALDVAVASADLAEVVVPNVYGMDEAAAAQTLGEARLVATFLPEAAPFPAGTAFLQDPAAGAVVRTGTSVQVKVAAAPPGGWAPALVKVPRCVGRDRADAIRVLAEAALAARIQYRPAPDQPVDVVEDQDPPYGAMVAQGSTVQLFLPEATTVPDVAGATREDAIVILQAAGLDPVPSGPDVGAGGTQVAAQSVPAGTVVARGSRVVFTYAFTGPVGPVYDTVVVPSVIGLGRNPAVQLLQGAGLGIVFYGPSRAHGKAVMIAQDPPAGTLVRRGTTVRVTYAYGVSPPPGGSPGGSTARPGPGPGLGKVPRVIGLSRSQAEALLASGGFGAVFTGPGPGYGYPVVVDQTPPPGVMVARGSVVTVRLAWRH